MRNMIPGLLILVGFALSGCGGGTGAVGAGAGSLGMSPAGGGQTTAAQTNLVVYLSDSPVDEADAVYVTIERVEVLHDEEGARFEVLADDPQQFDLLTLQNDVNAVLGEGGFPPGDYAGIRLILADNGFNVGPQVNVPDATVLPNYIVTDGDASPLFTPSGTQTGIKLLDPFVLSEGTITELRIDFNARTSIVKLGKQDRFILKPRLTLIPVIVSGSLSGTVTSADPAAAPLGTATVSAQQDGDEVLSTRTRMDGTFTLNPLREGTYTLVVTATGFGTAVQENVDVIAEQDVGGNDFVLTASDTGSLAGLTTPGNEELTIRVEQNGHLITLDGVDPDDGTFSFEDLPVGTYDLALLDDGVEAARLTGIEVLADTVTGGLLLGVGAISGRISALVDDAGIENAMIVAKQGETVILAAQSAADGTYVLAPLEPGTYDVSVTATGFVAAAVNGVEVVAGNETTTDVTLEAE